MLARYSGRPGCRFFLVVRRARGRPLVARLADPLVDASAAEVRDLLYPRLSALAAIDRAPGLELLVTIDQSASGGGVGVFTVRKGRIVRLRVSGAPARTLFWILGHNYYARATDCVGRLVVSTSAERAAPAWTWSVRRTFLRVDGTSFRRVRATVVRTRSLDRFPEFRPDALWFRSCPGFRLAQR